MIFLKKNILFFNIFHFISIFFPLDKNFSFNIKLIPFMTFLACAYHNILHLECTMQFMLWKKTNVKDEKIAHIVQSVWKTRQIAITIELCYTYFEKYLMINAHFPFKLPFCLITYFFTSSLHERNKNLQ